MIMVGICWIGALLVWLTRRPVLALSTGLLAAVGSWLLPGSMGTPLAIAAGNIGFLTMLFSWAYIEQDRPRYYALVLLFIGAMIGLVTTTDLLLLFFFWEITALCSFALIAFDADNPVAQSGGMRALIITQIGGVGLLIGVLLAVEQTGSTHFSALEIADVTVIAFAFLVAAAAKSAQFPFHSWLPGAMEAPTPISALIHAATMVNAGVYLLARFYDVFYLVPGWQMAVMSMGAVSAVLAALAALTAFDLKRVLAYSTVSQLGYMVYAVGAGEVFASQFHLISHALFKGLLFLAAGAMIHAFGTRDIRQIGARGMPLVAATFTIGALALIGVPPLNGFWSKELILAAESPLSIMPLLTAGLTALYTTRLMWFVLQRTQPGHRIAPVMVIPLGVLALGTLTSWMLVAPHSDLVGVHMLTLPELTGHVLHGAPLVLAVIAVGSALWWLIRRWPSKPDPISGSEFGFEPLNRVTVRGVQTVAHLTTRLQTGQLAWNIALIVLTFIILVGVLWR